MKTTSAWLVERGCDEARLDAELLMADVLGCRRLDLYLDLDRPLLEDEVDRYRERVRRRGRREPLFYILGEREFYGLSFKVTGAVLIPRPETEHLVDLAIAEVKRLTAGRSTPIRIADIGTGSGCVAIALAKAAKRELHIDAVDCSADALVIARENAASHEVGDRIDFHEGDLLAPLAGQEGYDMILSNPPYVPRREEGTLAPELTDHEPAQALFDEAEDGLDISRRLFKEAFSQLVPGGMLAVELGAGVAAAARSALESCGYQSIELTRDYADHERIIVARAPLES